MTKCLYCDLEAIPTEVFEGIQLYECKDGHRTGTISIENEEVLDKKKKLRAA